MSLAALHLLLAAFSQSVNAGVASKLCALEKLTSSAAFSLNDGVTEHATGDAVQMLQRTMRPHKMAEDAVPSEKPLVLIPGLGVPSHAALVRANLDLIRAALGDDFKCHLTIWAPDAQHNPLFSPASYAPCHVSYDSNRLGSFAAVKDLLMDPFHFSEHTGDIFFLHDDQGLKASTLALLQTLRTHDGVDVASATLNRSWCPMMLQHAGHTARSTRYVDFGASLMSNDAFKCLQKIINPQINPMGHGYDNVYGSLCSNSRMVLCDRDECVVQQAYGHSYSSRKAGQQNKRYLAWLKSEGMHFVYDECALDTTAPLNLTAS